MRDYLERAGTMRGGRLPTLRQVTHVTDCPWTVKEGGRGYLAFYECGLVSGITAEQTQPKVFGIGMTSIGKGLKGGLLL